MAGTIVQVLVATGDVVRVGQSLVILESMKMEHVVQATEAGTVEGVAVIVGDSVVVDQALVRLSLAEATAETPSIEDEEPASEGIRPDLQAVIDRHAFALDENRPHAVERRRSRGQRTARENIADLVDEDTFVEYGALAHAAQRARRDLDDLIRNTPADGLVAGIGTINQRGRCVVMSYDATVLAGTQGMRNHQKTDRMLQIAEAEGLALVLFAEGGGGRPGDTDTAQVAGLDLPTFAAQARLSGQVPMIGIASGRCFAGNAALLGCCDVVIATRDSTIGMGGPAMIEGGGLGVFAPEEIGPSDAQSANGVIDVLVDDEPAAVAAARQYLGYFQG